MKNPNENRINPELPHYFKLKEPIIEDEKVSYFKKPAECSVCGATYETEICVRNILIK